MSKYDNWTLAKLKAERDRLRKRYDDYLELNQIINVMLVDKLDEYRTWDFDGAGTCDTSFTLPSFTSCTGITSA